MSKYPVHQKLKLKEDADDAVCHVVSINHVRLVPLIILLLFILIK